MKTTWLLVCFAAGVTLCGCQSSEFDKVKADTEEARRSLEFARSESEDAKKAAEAARKDADQARVESAQTKGEVAKMRQELEQMRAERARLPKWVTFENGILEQTGMVDTGTAEMGEERRVNFALPYASPPEVLLSTPGTTDQKGIDLVRSTAVSNVDAGGFTWKRRQNPVSKSETYAGTLKWVARGIPAPK